MSFASSKNSRIYTRSEAESGFALAAALAVLLILSLMAVTVAANSHSELQIARAEVDRLKATVRADGAITMALYELVSSPPDQSEKLARIGEAKVTVGGETVIVRIESEAGKIDLNAASSDLIVQLAQAAGASSSNAADAANGLVAYRNEGAGNGHRDWSLKAKDLFEPKGFPIEYTRELTDINVDDADLIDCLISHSTTFSGLPRPADSWLSPQLSQLLDVHTRAISASVVGMSAGLGGAALSLSVALDVENGNSHVRTQWVRLTEDRQQPFWTLDSRIAPSRVSCA
jgi:Tfp pilus assembly protein PilX